jgi:hypothetical protein
MQTFAKNAVKVSLTAKDYTKYAKHFVPFAKNFVFPAVRPTFAAVPPQKAFLPFSMLISIYPCIHNELNFRIKHK